jgi:hypothetical protein
MDATDEERWAVWTVQARRFAQRENFTDAVARAELVLKEVRDALAAASDPAVRARLQTRLAYAQEQVAELSTQRDAWRKAIAERRQSTIDGAAAEMARPLPRAADER